MGFDINPELSLFLSPWKLQYISIFNIAIHNNIYMNVQKVGGNQAEFTLWLTLNEANL